MNKVGGGIGVSNGLLYGTGKIILVRLISIMVHSDVRVQYILELGRQALPNTKETQC
jgi:hypothetical protein